MTKQNTISADRIITAVEPQELGQLVLTLDAELLRTPPRPKPLRQESYDEEFDFCTLFYDAFVMADCSHIRLVGPSLLNLKSHIENGSVRALGQGADGRPAPVTFKLTSLQKTDQLDVVFDKPLDTAKLEFDFGGLGKHRVTVNDNNSDIFAGRRVVFTMFKYEPLPWLVDWADFNVKYHGADALLVYHNNSVHYSTAEISEALAAVEGLERVVVVHWPFKYGPGADGTGHWDSTFCQLGMFAQARARYLAKAKSVLNTDIDELVITEGHKSLFEMAEQSTEGYVPFGGVAIAGEETVADASEHRRHKDFTRRGDTPFGGAVGRKWVVVPHLCQPENQWVVHGVKGMAVNEALSAKATLCHFMGISTHWKPGANRGWKNARKFPRLEEAYAKIGWE